MGAENRKKHELASTGVEKLKLKIKREICSTLQQFIHFCIFGTLKHLLITTLKGLGEDFSYGMNREVLPIKFKLESSKCSIKNNTFQFLFRIS